MNGHLPRKKGPGHGDAGETLLELIVAMTILGIAGVAVMTGLSISVKSSDQHRQEATSSAYVRAFAEAIQTWVDANGLVGCPPGSDPSATYKGRAPALPSGYQPSVDTVEYWGHLPGYTPSDPRPGWVSACEPGASQRLGLKVAGPGGTGGVATDERLTVVLRQPCNATGALPCG